MKICHIAIKLCERLGFEIVGAMFHRLPIVDLGDCFSRFALSLSPATAPQSGPLGSEISGATEIHYYLQSQKG